MAGAADAERCFATDGRLPSSSGPCTSTDQASMPVMAYTRDFGRTDQARSFMLIGYDEVKDIRYMDTDRPGTWSIKYNMVWDKLWGLRLFPDDVMRREMQFYLKHQNEFGLPLDSREAYSKSDWIMWAAAMAPDNDTFLQFSDRIYHYADRTPTRWPLSDWYWTNGDGSARAFRARSVIGGHWMKVLMDRRNRQ